MAQRMDAPVGAAILAFIKSSWPERIRRVQEERTPAEAAE